MSASDKTIPLSVVERIESRYPEGTPFHEVFFWMWNELKGRHPDVSCKATERYVGLYTSKRNNNIFAYIDPLRAGISVGLFESVFDRLNVQSYQKISHPDWNKSDKLIRILVEDKIPETIDILAAAMQARIYGKQVISPISSVGDAEVKRLLPKVKRDIEALEQEEERFEGERQSRYSNYYERDPKIRAQAIAIHGLTCMVKSCGFNFEKVYGDHGLDFVEVHHLNPLSVIDPGEKRKTNPRTDLVVVCSNCHRMIHRCQDQVLSLEEVNTLILEKRKQDN